MLVFVKFAIVFINYIMLKSNNSTIAVIDSGLGGVSILKQLIEKNKCGNYIYVADNLYMPYGNKSKSFISKRIEELITMLKTKYNVSHIVIGCNTASSCIKNLRSDVTTMKFDKNFTYFATELTKKSLTGHKVIADKTLAKQIEKYITNKPILNKIIKYHVKKHNLSELKSLVLACTHYELVKDIFSKNCPNTKIINNSEFIIDSIPKPNSNEELNVVVLLTKKDLNLENTILKVIKE